MTDQIDRDVHDVSLTEPVSAPEKHGVSENVKADTDTLGEASGGFLGAVGGMALGAVGGPIGLVLGGVAGALGGWWAGHEVADAITEEDVSAYRTEYERSPAHLADRSFESVSAAYAVGHLAARNPEYAGRTFEQIEPDLERGWNGEGAARFGPWPVVRTFARAGYDRAAESSRST